MMTEAGKYSFPTLAEAGRVTARNAEKMMAAREEVAVSEAVSHGYADGLSRGRAEAEAAAKLELEAAREAGIAEGHAQGLAEMRRAAAALADALARFQEERAGLVHECEVFCVELALAIVDRLIGTSAARADFVSRAVTAALKVLAPEPPHAIFLNPADRKLVKDALAGLPLKEDEALAPGHARIEAGRLLVEAGIEGAFDQIKSAVVEVKTRRGRAKARRGDKR